MKSISIPLKKPLVYYINASINVKEHNNNIISPFPLPDASLHCVRPFFELLLTQCKLQLSFSI